MSKTLLLATCLFVVFCAREENFPALGQRIASPVDVAVSDDGKHFYVLNSDYDRTYDRGSLLVLDAEGNKLRAISIPRMARHLVVAGTQLLVTFDRSTAGDAAAVQLYSLAEPSKPSLQKSWTIACLPLNASMRKDFAYFFISCAQGELFIGNSSNLLLKHVRTYQQPRRALHLDPQRGLLYAFVTAVNRQRFSDETLEDIFTINEQGDEIEGADNVPDAWAQTGNFAERASVFQYAIYDIFAARDAKPEPFPLLETDLSGELHWLHFPRWRESEAGDSKTYRTNFYDTHPDPDDQDSFYLSQRGAIDSASNNIVRATIDEQHQLKFNVIHSADDEDDLRFPSDIEVRRINSTKTLLVNSFRGFVNWPRTQVFFGITARALTQTRWQKSCTSQQLNASYYRFAANEQGTVVVSSFYGNRVHIFQLQPEKDFICTKSIE